MRRLPPDQIENATTQMMDQLAQHLLDMTDLHRQVERARGECGRDGEGAELFDELSETLKQHRNLIAEQMRELSGHAPVVGKRGRQTPELCGVE